VVNNGGGMHGTANSEPKVDNCIFWGNIDGGGQDESAQIFNDPGDDGTTVINYSCVQGWTGGLGGEGNIGADPMFKDADGADDIAGTEDDNLELSYESPCIDAGDSNSVPPDYADLDEDGDTSEVTPLDLAGHARFTDDPVIADIGAGTLPIVDMGAYERYEFCGSEAYPYPQVDYNHDCRVNLFDLAYFAQYWLQYTGPE
jgi:hypothetical protein